MENQNKTYKFHVHGMHCKACTILIESELGEMQNISKVKSNLKNNSVEIVGNFGEKSKEQIAEELTGAVCSHGYTISVEKQIQEKRWSDFKIAFPIAILFLFFFVFLQKMGLINLVSAGNVTYGTAFMIGIIASLSTCMAVVGGIVLSMSATFAKEGNKIKPALMFHGGRILSFFLYFRRSHRCYRFSFYFEYIRHIYFKFFSWIGDVHSRY